MSDIVVLDYGAGNLRSVVRAIAHVGFQSRVTSDPGALASAGAVILPGVGAAADTMRNLTDRGLVEPIRRYVDTGRPFLGICMGLQALFDVSEEGGEHACLGLIPGRVRRLPEGLKVPHMGWNEVYIRQNGTIFDEIPSGEYFYFVHSYYVDPEDRSVIAAETDYGLPFTAAVSWRNVAATQFHPEKSGEWGLRIYKNFLRHAVGVPKLLHTSAF